MVAKMMSHGANGGAGGDGGKDGGGVGGLGGGHMPWHTHHLFLYAPVCGAEYQSHVSGWKMARLWPLRGFPEFQFSYLERGRNRGERGGTAERWSGVVKGGGAGSVLVCVLDEGVVVLPQLCPVVVPPEVVVLAGHGLPYKEGGRAHRRIQRRQASRGEQGRGAEKRRERERIELRVTGRGAAALADPTLVPPRPGALIGLHAIDLEPVPVAGGSER